MAKAQDTSIDDLADAIGQLATAMETGFAQLRTDVETGFAQLRTDMETGFRDQGSRISAVEREQRGTNERLDRLEGRHTALEDDIKELYRLIDELRTDFHVFTVADKRRFDNLEDFAKRLAKHTGVPYVPSTVK